MTLVMVMLASIPAAFLVGLLLESCNPIHSLLAFAGVLILYYTFTRNSSTIVERRKANERHGEPHSTNRQSHGVSRTGSTSSQFRLPGRRNATSASKQSMKAATDVDQAKRVLEDLAYVIASKTTDEEFEFIMKRFEIMCERDQSAAGAPKSDSMLRSKLMNEGIQLRLVKLEWFLA